MTKLDPDAAIAALRMIRVEFGTFLSHNSPANEADTRANLIDRILTEVCCWPDVALKREEHVESGFIDYYLSVGYRPYAAVEAKREGIAFSFPETSSKTLKLSGSILTDKAIAEAIKQ